jgi:hypothetical protein
MEGADPSDAQTNKITRRHIPEYSNFDTYRRFKFWVKPLQAKVNLNYS